MLSFEDIKAVVQVKYLRTPIYERKYEGEDIERCWQLLKMTSRSFAAVIEELHPELRNPMMIFYLVLRGLDTIEDDTQLDHKIKLPLLKTFATDVLPRKDWTFTQSSETEKDRVVLFEFDKILRVYHNLRLPYQEIIADITRKMGLGMAEYASMESQMDMNGLKTIKDYDLYCHHVAGIVGEGITRMALISKFGDSKLSERPELFESMGQFLQKTNIIRDYREDYDDGRSFWPQEVWKNYAANLGEFRTNHKAGMHCVSHLTLLSLRCVIDCLEYLNLIKEPTLFRFCAIPQVMSIATLELVFNNPEVFSRNVKISKGLACQLILAANNMTAVNAIFKDFVLRIHSRNLPEDPNFFTIEQECARIVQYINTNDAKNLQLNTEPKSGVYFLGLVELTDTELESAKILAFCGAFGIGVAALMLGIACYFGARYPNPLNLLLRN